MSLEERKWNIEQCNRCHHCKIIPMPRSQRFSAACPAIEYGQFHAYSGSGKIITGYALMEGRVQYSQEMEDSLTTCSMCGACDTTCRTLNGDLVAPMDSLYEIRAKMFDDGRVPPAQRVLLENIVQFGNPQGKSREQQTRWAEGLNLVHAGSENVDVLLHVGCGSAFDESQWPGLLWLVQVMKKANLSFGTLGAEEPHAGGLAYDLGHQSLARRCAEETIRLVRASGARMLVTADAESLAAFRNFYPRMGLTLEPVRVLHVTEFLDELCSNELEPAFAACEEVVAYHDPCRLGRLSEPFVPWEGKWTSVMNGLRVSEPPQPPRYGLGGVYDAPRRLLQSVPGTRLVEMERCREFSYCCGAGGGGQAAHPDFAEQAAGDRLAEAVASGATTLVTSCSNCVRHLGETARKVLPDLRVVSLLDYLKNAASA